LAVRKDAFVGAQALMHLLVHRIPASNVRDDRDTSLLVEAGCGEMIIIF
jgi:hypothetical protein